MSRFAAIRWIRGLIPTFIMLFFAACFGLVVLLSTWGLPSSVRKIVEKELSIDGNLVSMNSLKISLWAGCVLEANDVVVKNVNFGANTVLKVEKLRVDLDWSSLMGGDVVVDHVEMESISLNALLTSRSGNDPRYLSLDQFDAVVRIGSNNSIHIGKMSGFLQGMKVLVSGELPLDCLASSNDAPQLDWDELRSSLYDVAGYLEGISWKKGQAPVWSVNISELGTKDHSLRVELDVRAQEIAFRGLRLRDFLLNATYAGDIIQVKKISCRGDETSGMIDAEAAVDLTSRKIHVDLRSSAPVLRWLRDLTREKLFLPYHIELTSNPSVSLSAKLEMDESWSKIEKINVLGKASVGTFRIGKEAFRKFSAELYYDNGNFYVSDLTLVHREDAFTGQIMGIGKELLVDVRSSLSADVIVHLVRSFGDNTFNIPEELELRGAPDLIARGKVNFVKGWSNLPEIEKADIELRLNDFTVREVEMGTLDLQALVSGKNFTLKRCVLKRQNEELKVSGTLVGRDIDFNLQSTFPIQIFDQLLPGVIEQPERLKLPSSLDLIAEGNVVLKPDGGFDLHRLNGALSATDIGWNGVVFQNVAVDASYDRDKIDVRKLKLDNGKGFLEFSAKGDLQDALHLEGRNTICLYEWDRLLGIQEDDFFVKRFKVSDKTMLDLSFQADLSMKAPDHHYDVRATLQTKNIEYNGVFVESGSTSARIVPGKSVLSDVLLVYDNSGFLSSRKIRGGSSRSTLKASNIEFDFNQQTVAIQGLSGTVYPDYVLRMFSPSAAEVLGDFLFTRTVAISGNGVFPLEDDFSKMKATISFTASSGQIEYPLLGTVLKMTNSSGSISISPEWVVIDRLKGKIWGGTFDGKIGARIDKGDDINGVLVLQDLDLAQIGASYNEKMNTAVVHGSISFKSNDASLNSIIAHGSAQLYNGNLVEIPLFGQLGKAISAFIPGVGHLVNYNITSANCDYAIESGYIKSNSFEAKGTNMSLTGGGWIRLSDLRVNADFKLGLRGLPGLFTSPIFLVAGGFFKVSGIGPLDDIDWNLSPFSSIKTNPEPKQQQSVNGERKKDEKSSKWKFWE